MDKTTNKIKILVDSGSDISKDYCKKYNIDVVPLNIIYNNKSHKDFYEIDPVSYCEYLETCKEIPTTSQPSPTDFVNYFNKYKDDYDHIICITMAPAGSGTFNSANLAKEIFKEQNEHCQIHVLDSRSCGLNETLEAKATAKMIEKGKDIYTILSELEEMSHKICTYYLVDDINFLIKGGRVSTLKGAIASKLRLKPIITIRQGIGSNLTNAVGFHNGLDKLVNYFFQDADETSTAYISHANCYTKALALSDKLKAKHPKIKTKIFQMNCVMATQAGPGSLGLFFKKSI